MKLSLSISLCFTLLLVGETVLAQDAPPEFNLQGAVKKITETSTFAGMEGAHDSTTYLFSESGILIQQIDNQNLEYTCNFITTFDKKGNNVSKKCRGCTRVSTWVNSYNELGLLVKLEAQQWHQSTTYSYDDQNYLIESIYTDSSDLRSSIFRKIMSYKYDSLGNNIIKITKEQEIANTSFDTTLVKLMNYDSLNQPLETYIYGSSYGIPVLYFQYFTHDLSGNLICEIQKYNDTTHQHKLDSIYFDTKFVLKIRAKQANQNDLIHEHKSEYEYDNYGNITLEKTPTYRLEYKYVYDEQGNWIEKQSVSQSGFLTKRVITYYR